MKEMKFALFWVVLSAELLSLAVGIEFSQAERDLICNTDRKSACQCKCGDLDEKLCDCFGVICPSSSGSSFTMFVILQSSSMITTDSLNALFSSLSISHQQLDELRHHIY